MQPSAETMLVMEGPPEAAVLRFSFAVDLLRGEGCVRPRVGECVDLQRGSA